jgi:hypothetical protein
MIKYGIDSFILPSPWSLIVSILIFSGTSILGHYVLKFTKSYKIINDISGIYYQCPIFGFLSLLLIIYPLVLFNLVPIYFIKVVALLLVLLNFFFFRLNKLTFNFIFKPKIPVIIDLYLVILLVIGYFLISLTPITSADSLDYHSSTAIDILNYGTYPNQYYLFHSRTAGSGELLISLGFSLGAEQLGSLIQFSGLLSIIGLIINFCKRYKFNNNSMIFFVLLFLITPILVFLNSTNKPQLMPIALTSICFVLVFFQFQYLNKIKKNNHNYNYFLVVVLLSESFLLKYSFALSCSIIGAYSLFQIINKKNYLSILLFSTLIVLAIIGPYSLWKYINFEKNIFYALFWALPQHLYGYNSFMLSISNCGYTCFPVWVLWPRSVNEATNFFGILFCFFVFLKINNTKNFAVLSSIIIYIIIAFNFGQSQPRFFFEPAIWFIFLLISSSNFFKTKMFNYLYKHIVRFQGLFIIIIIYFSLFSLLPGSLSNESRNEVLNKNANGYTLIKWVTNVLNANDVILLTHRSISIPNLKSVPLFFINYLDPKDQRAKIYFEEIKKENPNYIVFTGEKETEEDKYKKIFNSCLGEMAFTKKKIHRIATRNPFITGNPEDAFIYNFYSENLPECLAE